MLCGWMRRQVGVRVQQHSMCAQRHFWDPERELEDVPWLCLTGLAAISVLALKASFCWPEPLLEKIEMLWFFDGAITQY